MCAANPSTLARESARVRFLNPQPQTLTQGYACTSLNLARTLSADAAHLTPVLVDRLLDHVGLLVGDEHATVASLSPACAASALAVIAHALRATASHNRTAGALAAVVTRFEAGMVATLRETAAGLIAGQVCQPPPEGAGRLSEDPTPHTLHPKPRTPTPEA